MVEKFEEDFERISQMERLILQADQWEEEQSLLKEQLPATVTLIIEENEEHNDLAFRRDSEERIFTRSDISVGSD